MVISYKKLWILLLERDMKKGDLRALTGLSTSSIAKLTKGENVNTDILVKICVALNCSLPDIMELVPDKSKEEKANGNNQI
ncbi:transcriptional regulator [Clostridia bacterium]|nr:transcriptional regulator [Clostridia bacterium]